ncbi:MAG: UbiA family prenyltransferase [Planctomycetes bacterium]|nr:UbiA family prenyltransferase [Planctomycetota bacterium]
MFRPAPAALSSAKAHLENIKFSHSIFALPFAAAGAALAVRDLGAGRPAPDARAFIIIVICVVAARTCAMATNRVADAAFDARNPRTAARAIPAGQLSKNAVLTLGIVAALVFVAGAFALSPLCGSLAPGVLAVLAGYSWTKRFTPWSHVFLGVALGLAPGGAWLAIRGDFSGNIMIPILVGIGVVFWVAGFDMIYACQDAEFDRKSGLHSVPARFGISRALRISSAFHAGAAALFIATGIAARLGWIYFATVAAIAGLLIIEHRIVKPDDLSRVDAAFFTINGWVSVGFLMGLLADVAVAAPPLL